MMEVQRISLVIIDDHPLFRQGLEDVFRLENDLEIVGVASTGQEGLSLIKKLRPHIGITDVNLPDLSGLIIVKEVAKARLGTKMVLLTAYDDLAQKLGAFQMGARGYITKDVQPFDLVEQIRAVAKGYYIISDKILTHREFIEWLALQTNSYNIEDKPNEVTVVSSLSPREMEVLNHLSQGQSNKEIARQMGISHQTVKNHLASLFRKLGVEDRTQAVVFALQHGLVRMHPLETKE
ncbi:MAG: response regulator transcription factor [Anaerolineales bacterium]|nr:response regulator transcription factor [Anaerolineales bacterium]